MSGFPSGLFFGKKDFQDEKIFCDTQFDAPMVFACDGFHGFDAVSMAVLVLLSRDQDSVTESWRIPVGVFNPAVGHAEVLL